MKYLYLFIIILTFNNFTLSALEVPMLSPAGDGLWVGGEPIVCPDGIIRGGKVCTMSRYGFWVGGTKAIECPDGVSIKGGTECVLAPDGTWVGVE